MPLQLGPDRWDTTLDASAVAELARDEHTRTYSRVIDGETVTFTFSHRRGHIGTYARVELAETIDVDVDGETVTLPKLAYRANGRPIDWAESAPDPTALLRTPTRAVRSRKGRSSYVKAGRRPNAVMRTGDASYVDSVADMAATLVTCTNDAHAVYGAGRRIDGCRCGVTESWLLAAAEAFTERVTQGAETLDKVIGFAVARPQVFAGDRSTIDATTCDDDDYVSPALERWRRVVAARTGHPTFVHERTRRIPRRRTVLVAGGRSRYVSTYRAVGLDEPSPTRATIGQCARHRSDVAAWLNLGDGEYFAGEHGNTGETSIRDRHRARLIIPRRGRLNEQQREAADIAVVRVGTYGVDGAYRADRQVLGRRTATTTELVTFADSGYWLGHRFIAPEIKPPAPAPDPTGNTRGKQIAETIAALLAMQVGDRIGEPGNVAERTAQGWRIGNRELRTPASAARTLAAS